MACRSCTCETSGLLLLRIYIYRLGVGVDVDGRRLYSATSAQCPHGAVHAGLVTGRRHRGHPLQLLPSTPTLLPPRHPTPRTVSTPLEETHSTPRLHSGVARTSCPLPRTPPSLLGLLDSDNKTLQPAHWSRSTQYIRDLRPTTPHYQCQPILPTLGRSQYTHDP